MNKNTSIRLEDLQVDCLITRGTNVLIVSYTSDEKIIQCVLQRDGNWTAQLIQDGDWKTIGKGVVWQTYFSCINQANDLALRFLYEHITGTQDPWQPDSKDVFAQVL